MSCKDCEQVILSQKSFVRDAYFRYYGPLLTACRIKLHGYLKLRSEQDYKYFFHWSIKQYFILRSFAANEYYCQNELAPLKWREAIQQYYPQKAKSDKKQVCFHKWSHLYARKEIHLELQREQVLASSKPDLLLILFRTFAASSSYKEMLKRTPFVMAHFGYYHDAVKLHWLDALTITINEKYEAMEEEDYEERRYNQLLFGLQDESCDFLSSLCIYFNLGSCDYVGEQLLLSIDQTPHFHKMQAYLNVLKQQEVFYEFDLEQYLHKGIVKILKCTGPGSMNFANLEDFWSMQQNLEPPDELARYIRSLLSFKQIMQLIYAVQVVPSVEWGWAVWNLINVYKSEAQSLVIFNNLIVEKLNKGLVEEAKYLVLAASSNPYRDFTFESGTELQQDSKSAVVEMLIMLLDCDIVVTNARKFALGAIFKAFARFTVDHWQLLLRTVMLSFSRVHYEESLNCDSFHIDIWHTVESLGGPIGFGNLLLNIDIQTLSLFHECLIFYNVCDYCLKWTQQMLDDVSTRLMELYCQGGESKHLEILAHYIQLILDSDLYSELSFQRLEEVATQEQLQSICEHLPYDNIASLTFGHRFLKPWMNEVVQISEEPKFLDNLIKIVQLCYANNSSKLWKVPYFIRSTIKRVIANALVTQPETSSSRFWFFEGLPLFIMLDEVIVKAYVELWPYVIIISQSLRVPGIEELARGLFHYIESNNNFLLEEKVELIQLYQAEAKILNDQSLQNEIHRLINQSSDKKLELLLAESEEESSEP
ncbi:hypothetical protein MP228_010482 [Amoeboaphelidium protococcarum]|nr:hypothetical protein MP228_010482 [Amoeboaphelidium protococcarum]